MTQVETVQLWREVTGNSELEVNIINNIATVDNIKHTDSQKLLVYYKFNSLFLNLNSISKLNSNELIYRIWMNVYNIKSFEQNNKKWSLSK
jgi:molybdopterin converting factor small subunit